MAASLDKLFANNRAWAQQMLSQDPQFFAKLVDQQAPEYLWIGCSDSRVPANQITGLAPGEVFVHRNVGNVVAHTDLNCVSVIQFAVDLIGVKHIVVVGHYGCSGVKTVLDGRRVGVADNWLRHIEDVQIRHAELLGGRDGDSRVNLLCELNVVEQVGNVCRTTVVEDAWRRGQQLTVHGWVYGLKDGLVRDLRVTVDGAEQWAARYRDAVAALRPNR